MPALKFQYLGVIPYLTGREVQEEFLSRCVQDEHAETIFLCEHPPTITLGLRAKEEEILLGRDALRNRGIEVCKTTRGGAVTAHEPGQLVIYPVLHLKTRKLSPKCAVDLLLRSITKTLNAFGCPAEISREPVGVFVDSRKIASVGLKIIRGITNHGVSVNISNDLKTFDFITSCGDPTRAVTSLNRELKTYYGVQDLLSKVEECLRENLE